MKPHFADENIYDGYIKSSAQLYSVPAWLIKAIIAQESNYRADVSRLESHLNDASIGLMQILFSTAQSTGFGGTREQLFMPVYNIQYGTKFLAGLLASAKGDVERAISAYNAGWGNSARQPKDAVTGFCLARVAGKCVRVYKFKAGEFGNQPYVSSVLDYARNYGSTLPVPPVLGKIENISASGVATPASSAASPQVLPGLQPPATLGPTSSVAPPVVAPPVVLRPSVGTLPEPSKSNATKVGGAAVALIAGTIWALLRGAFSRSPR